MKFKFISPKDPYYRDERMLRWEVLRKPLGMPPGSEMHPEDPDSFHLIALEKKKLIGCVIFHPESNDSGRVFHLALSEDYRGKGFGRQMMATLESHLVEKGIQNLYILAREDVLGFYKRIGFACEGPLVDVLGTPHYKMKKTLLAAA